MSEKPWVGKSVVVIDDSEQMRQALETAYRAAGMKVVGLAKNGVEGIEMVLKFRPEVASIDIIMPEMDGIECVKLIRAKSPSTKCLFVTWLASEQRIAQSLAEYVPAHAFQPKPFTNADIESRIKLLYYPPKSVAPGIRNTIDETTSELSEIGVKVS